MNSIDNTFNWWMCDNIVHPGHAGQLGLLHLASPTIFILIRNYADAYFATFEDFAANIAEVNYLYPDERATHDTEALLVDAWNFLARQEQAEEALLEGE